MFVEKHFPSKITGVELDRYLDKGWYRMGQIIFTTHFLFYENALYSPIWIRLPLKDYRFRKSLRKIKKSVENQFRVEVREGVIDPYKEDLYNIYKQSFKGYISPTLSNGLMDSGTLNIYDSKTVEIFDGKKLIGFSFFDIGKNSIASIQGVYHPNYAKHSLGFYTMIQEIQYGLDNGFEYYYPGYVAPGLDRFDYKLRVGKKEEIEFYNLYTRSWENYSKFDENRIPVNVIVKKLSQLGWRFSKENINCQMLYFASYEEPVFGPKNNTSLKSPLFISIFHHLFEQPKFIAYFDIWKEKFILMHTLKEEELYKHFNHSEYYDRNSTRQFLNILSQKSIIIESKNILDIVSVVKSISTILEE